ncbi:MAG TPA: O-antigen ligase family protein [Patescibacteria group bacterium]|nr:O-antigen ligase family protein [Patescibacteria group bacterium]
MFLQSIIAIIQFIKNGSIGLSKIGEQILSSKIDGVAKIMFGAAKHIRPYGTFSHPNILALFLVVAGIIALHLLFNYKDRIYKIFIFIFLVFISIALLLTFSRVLWLLTFITWGIMFFKQIRFNTKKFKKLLPYFSLIVVLVAIIAAYIFPAILWRINPFDQTFWQSFNDRMIIFGKAWIMIKSHFLGIGIGNFVIEEAYLLTGYPLWMAEPAHNTYFLVLAEIGWFGLLSFLSFIYLLGRNIKKVPLYLKCIFFVVVIYMFFDHCFWDIRQSQILAMIFFALVYIHGNIVDKEAR